MGLFTLRRHRATTAVRHPSAYIRSTITITSSNYNIVPFPIYNIYNIYIIHIYTVFTIFATPTGAGSINAAVLTADQRHYYRHRRHYYHLSLCPLPRAASRFYCVFTPGSHYLNVYISFTQLCICVWKSYSLIHVYVYTHII